MAIRRDVEDFTTIDAAVAALQERGFKCVGPIDWYRMPERDPETGYYQVAEVFVPHNMTIGRVSFWPSI